MRAFLKAAAVSVLALAAALPASAESLADALVAAYTSSKILDQNEALLRAADEDVAGSVAGLRPVISFLGQSRYNDPAVSSVGTMQTTYSLVAQWTLLDFGRRQLGVQIAKETVLATREALRGLEQKILLQAVDAFVNVRLQSEIVALRQSNVRLIGEELKAAKDRFDVGEVTRTDVALAEARLASAQSGLVAAQGDLTTARERYKAVTGAYPGKLSALPKLPATPKSLDEARTLALATHPDILQAQRQVTVADLGLQAARAERLPTLKGEASISRLDQTGTDSKALSLTLTQPLYTGGAIASGQRAAFANKEAAQAALAQTAITIAESVGNAWSAVDVAQASIAAGNQQITAAQTAFDGVKEEATLGARTTLDVLDAEQELLNARAQKLTAEAQRYVGVYNLLASMGLLSVEHLKLGVPVYDPATYYNAVKKAPISVQGKALDRIMKRSGN
ncbi:TolC family outer membrane protein [Paragemmobacter straminiformis]|uniref:TolC family outer membrane protein n=1 Tax=Paragemmobacter straminiformis TaxID=2045119 RepID=A0A842I9W8_9RHOB|nr:TolC family outer membrane protein [Gemmobacter straminiformis]MBC2836650.1 TolC family outer membrane protein [Gemmobacter straminiformis]